MKRLLSFLVVLASFYSVYPQNKQAAQIKAKYRFTSLSRHVDGHDFEKTDDMILLASPVGSRFFSAKTEQYDSLMATPGGKKKYNELLSYAAKHAFVIENGGITFDSSKVDIPSNGVRFQVTKPDDAKELTVIDFVAQEYFKYQVPLDELTWTIEDSTKTVLGYKCQMATADYHGRKWTAWFAPDIPVSSGPWQLMGLPGLIMDAQSEGGEYKFEIIGLEQTNQPIKPRPGSYDYTKTTRKNFRRLQREIHKNPGKAFPDGSVRIINSEESMKARMAHDLIETDYE
ncbi:MAG: GLPGLI family protein [Muribaculaceae bacterium]|nr:GLPGLI family protein [Muribaculaceae bacterium]MDE6754456.1 GLPGLI family protein [Muribaculaceae bacterium]